MASFRSSPSISAAVRQQPSCVSPYLRSTQFITSKNLLQFPARPSSSKLAVPARQTRTFLAKLARRSPSTQAQQQPQQQTQQTQQTEQQKQNPPLQLTNLPYFVRRTPSNNLPVYLVTKAGGTKRQTKIQKTEGDLEALRTDLARALGLEPADGSGKKSPDVTINQLNGHIIVKGWRKPEIQKFLLERNF
ncbi:putative mitochondrial large ribosomal subunit L49 [Thermoascus aurantiacus ATCC 26904]